MTRTRPIGTRWERQVLSLLIGLSTLGVVGTAHGKECLKASFPDQTTVDGTTLMLNGLGLRQATALKVNVYVAALYVTKPASDGDAILGAPGTKQLILHFVRNVGRSDLNKAWEEGFEANAKGQRPALKERIEKFKALMPDMKSGERLTFTSKPGSGVVIDVGGAAKGTIEGDDFAKALLSIWLGAHPPNANLKTGLLGGPCA
jgi:chalcone isomerase-like protein